MPRTDLFLKVEIEHDAQESPQALAEEICRRIQRIHGVRSAELSTWVAREQEGSGG